MSWKFDVEPELEEYAEHCRRVAAEVAASHAGVKIEPDWTVEEIDSRTRQAEAARQWRLWCRDPQDSINALEEEAARLKRQRLSTLRNIRKLRKLLPA